MRPLASQPVDLDEAPVGLPEPNFGGRAFFWREDTALWVGFKKTCFFLRGMRFWFQQESKRNNTRRLLLPGGGGERFFDMPVDVKFDWGRFGERRSGGDSVRQPLGREFLTTYIL